MAWLDLDELPQLFTGVLGFSAQRPALARWLLTALYSLQRNTRRGSRRNIGAHYDIGNDLFATFLDREHWMYSSAVFPHRDASLEEASTYKLERLLDIRPEHHLLEIGAGWGGLAIHAAKTRGCRVSTTTISEAQYAHTARRIEEEGLGGGGASRCSSRTIASSRGVMIG